MKKTIGLAILLLASCSEIIESGAIDGYEKALLRGQYYTVIRGLKTIEPSAKRYKEAQELLVRLETGFNIFSAIRGSWRYEDGGHIYPIFINTDAQGTWIYKQEENTIYTKASKCHNTGSAFTECDWVLHMRYLGYDGKTIKVRRYFATEEKFQDMRIFP